MENKRTYLQLKDDICKITELVLESIKGLIKRYPECKSCHIPNFSCYIVNQHYNNIDCNYNNIVTIISLK